MGLDSFEYLKVPPQDQELEEAVLGALLIEPISLYEVADFLQPKHFYNNAHAEIYNTILDVSKDSEVDMLTVTQKLRAKNKLEDVGGSYYIAQLTRRVGSAAHIHRHAFILTSLWKKRELISVLHEGQNDLFTNELNGDEIADKLSMKLVSLDSMVREYHISDVAKKNREYVEKVRSGEISNIGIPTGMSDLDEMIGGLQPPDLILVAGRPGMGKTAFALSILANVCVKNNVKGLFFSLEMSADQLDFRLESMYSGIPYQELKAGKINSLELRRYDEAQKILSESGVYIDDDPDLTPESIRTKAIRMKMKHDIKVVFVDYIQLMESKAKSYSRENEISKISRSLKKLAKELDVPVVALSQLNREVEKRNPPEPRLSDLRESGAIEQDCDIIMLLYRPEYYGIDTIEKNGEHITTTDMCVVDVAKHRNGKTGKVPVMFRSSLMRFGDFGSQNEIVEELPF